MPVIEGVGDEVFNVLLIALIVFLGIVGWWSTSISEQPLIRTVLILEPRHHTAAESTANVSVPNPPQDTGQHDPVTTNDVPSDATVAPNTSPNVSKNETQGSQEQQPQAAGSTDPTPSSSQNSEENAGASCPVASDVSTDPVDALSSSDADEAPSETSASTNELRRRRLQFFEDRHGADIVPNSSSMQGEGPVERSSECAEPSSPADSIQEISEQRDTRTENQSAPSDPCQACDDIRIKLKFLNDNQKLVQGKLQEPLGDFKRRNFAVEMAARKVIRLIFNGQVLQSDDRTLQHYGLFDNCVVHCLVHNQRTTNQNVDSATNGNNGEELHFGGAEVGDSREWDMSSVMYISMFVILSAIWYLRINFSQLFSATSTVALFGLSGIFVIFLVGMYIPDQEVLRT